MNEGNIERMTSILFAMILVLFTSSRQVKASECTTVTDERYFCASGDSITLGISCDINYIMKIYSAEYYVSTSQQCPQTGDDLDHCFEEDVIEEVQDSCHVQKDCIVSLSKRANTNCDTGGIHYIQVIHTCEPLHFHNSAKATVTTLANLDGHSGYQLIYVNSHEKVLSRTDNNAFDDITLGCTMTLPSRTEIGFQLLYLLKSSPSTGCDQAIQIWTQNELVDSICEPDVTRLVTAGCAENENKVYIKYVNSDPQITVGFVFAIEVSHRVSGFSIECGQPVVALPPVPNQRTRPAPLPPTTPSSESESSESDDPIVGVQDKNQASTDSKGFNVTLLIALLATVGGIALLVAVIGTVIRKLRQKKVNEAADLESLEEQSKAPSFVRDIYLDGGTKSRLVMESKLADNGSLGFSTMGIRI